MSTHGFSQEGRLEELLRHTLDVVVELSPDGRLVYVSDSVERVLGRPAASLTGSNFLEIVIPREREASLAIFRKVVETGDESLIRFHVPHENGHRVEFETTVRCFIDSEDRQRIVAVCRDITERSTRSAADQQRNAHHRAIAQSAARPVAIVAADGIIRFSNRHFRQIFGNHTNLNNTKLRISKESLDVLDAAWHRSAHSHDIISGASEFEYRHEDGSTSWFSVTWEAIQSRDENRQFALFYEDITRRKKAEYILRAMADESFDTRADTLKPIMTMMAEALEIDRLVLGVLDDETSRLRVLVAWQDGDFLTDSHLVLDGLPDSAVLMGETCIHPTGVCELMPAVAERIGPDFESYAGFPLRRLDGSVIGVLGAYSRKAIHDTSVIRSLLSSFAAHAGAVIDRERQDAEIRRSRDRFDALALQSNDVLIEIDAEARITYVSHAGLTVLGFDPKALVGRPIEELTHPDDLPLLLARKFHEHLQPDEKQTVAVTRIRHADGDWRWLESTISSFKAADGSRCALILAREINEKENGEFGRRKLEEALRQTELRLSQAQKMETVGRLAGGIAHDFNNLLTAIIGYSHLVLDEFGEGHGAQCDLEEILRAAERAGGLTNQLLAFSRREVLQPKSFDLNAVVADIDRMLRRLIGEDIELVTLQDGELRAIFSDPGQIEQVLVNLVVNARDAMPQGGRIKIETANFSTKQAIDTASGPLSAGDYVVLSVSDTGTGIDEAIQAKIFEPFFTTKKAQRGTGLGLATVYSIVRGSNGRIDIESNPGRGTTFSIYLPTAREFSHEVQPDVQDNTLRGNETILLVEDSESVRRLVQKTLEKSGYRVLAAESATAALRLCGRHAGKIDLLLADIVLPKTSGPEVARRAVELRPGIRVLFMSGFTDDTLTRHGLRPGTAQILEKPFTPSAALSKIRSLLDADARPLEDALLSADAASFHVEHSQ